MHEPVTVRCGRCDGVIAMIDACRCVECCKIGQPTEYLCTICVRHHEVGGCAAQRPLWGI